VRWTATALQEKGKEAMKGLEAKRDYFREWLKRCGKAQESAPSIQQALEITEWELEALTNRPDEADEIQLGDLEARFEREYDHVAQTLPMMPEYDPGAIPTLTAVTTSGSASTYVYVTRVGGLGTQKAKDYADKYTITYRELQEAQSRPKEVEALLQKLGGSQTLERFSSAQKACSMSKSGIGARTAAALEMRTLLDGVKGDLFEKARRRQGENMT